MARQSRQGEAPSFLLTRPAAQGDRFAQALRDRFGAEARIVLSPLLAPEYLETDLPLAGIAGLIFTSETGVAAFRRLEAELSLPAWCVGDQTTAAARAAGLPARSAGGDAEALFDEIRAARPIGPLLHLRGEEARGDLARRLTGTGVETREAVLYRQAPQPLTPEARALLAGAAPVVMPLFSPRTAAILVRHLTDHPAEAPLWTAALSPAVDAELDRLSPARRIIAARPDAPAMLDALATLCAAGWQP